MAWLAWTTGSAWYHFVYTPKRRRERYQIIFLWKVAQGLVQGYPATFAQNERRGRLMQLAPLNNASPSAVKRAREASLQVKGAKLFNCIPRGLRDTFTGTAEQFKAGLDKWLADIPDQPTIPGRQRAATTNSLLDQVQYLQNWNYLQNYQEFYLSKNIRI